MFGDYLNFFYRWGLDALAGRYTAIYPLPMTAVFALFACVPPYVGLGLLLLADLVILVKVFGRRAPLWALYVPFLVNLTVGNLDMIFFYFYQTQTWWGLVLLTLKPQLFLLAVPRLFQLTRREWVKFCAGCAALYLPAFVVRPAWVLEWLSNIRAGDDRLALTTSASLWGYWPLAVAALAGVSALALARRRVHWTASLYCVLPVVRHYDTLLFAGESWALIPLSWLVQFIERGTLAYWTWSLLPLYLVLKSAIPGMYSRNSRKAHDIYSYTLAPARSA